MSYGMNCRRITLRNPHGLHARPAARLVMTATRFESDIVVRCGTTSANGKSIIGLLSLCARCGDEVEISAVGNDALHAIEAIEEIERFLNEAG